MSERVSAVILPEPSDEAIERCLAKHVRMYRFRKPAYQIELLKSLGMIWDPRCSRVLDVGAGTGILGQAIKNLFGVTFVSAVDVDDRFLETLDIDCHVFNGRDLPFDNASFDCAVLSNVLHHVRPSYRTPLLHEIGRVIGDGPLYIKDHLARSKLDHTRLAVLDILGNLPFGGMISAQYLEWNDWQALADTSGYLIEITRSDEFRHGVMAALFPNSLEITMRWRRH